MFKNTIIRILKKFDLKIVKISKNQNSFEFLTELMLKYNIDIVLDIGANIGQFASKLRNEGYENKIISFEPLTKEYNKLLEVSSKDKNWEIFEKSALGDTNGNINVNISSYSPSSSILEFSEEHSNAKSNAITIDTETVKIYKLDNIHNKLSIKNKNLMIKIDTQGYESNIIEGGEHTLKSCKILLCEVSFKELYKGQKLWDKTIAQLNKLGFHISFIENSVFNNKTHELLQADIIFVKND